MSLTSVFIGDIIERHIIVLLFKCYSSNNILVAGRNVGKTFCYIHRNYWEMESGVSNVQCTMAWGHENYKVFLTWSGIFLYYA